jgi:DNA modification methylase
MSQTTPKKQVKITPVKGRAMLQWIGKQPIGTVQSYPAQLVEQHGGKPLEDINFEQNSKDWQNLIFHGDNKEILSTLIAEGYRGKIDLIYIDPPFDSKADYIRKVELRGLPTKIEGEGQSVIEQTQYSDIWAGDSYLQFMYERLILLKELLSDEGSIYLHCDWHKSHHLRFLLDEVFGDENFVNEVIWGYKTRVSSKNYWNKRHDNIFLYSKSGEYIFNSEDVQIKLSENTIKKYRLKDELGFYRLNGRGITGSPIRSAKDVEAKWEISNPELVVRDYLREGQPPDDILNIEIINQNSTEREDYPTQKPEELLEQFILASSNPDSIVLDCFMGSGTTMAVAQKLGRRWIGCDINKGSIQTTAKRISKIITEQTSSQEALIAGKNGETNLSAANFAHYRVNNYDLAIQHNEFKTLIKAKLGIERISSEAFFDGKIGDKLVKLVEFNRLLTLADIELIKNELETRPDEERDILVAGLGVDVQVYSFLIDYNKLKPVNKIEVKDLRNDGLFINRPAFADVTFENGVLRINDFVSPTIMERMKLDMDIFTEQVTDFRSTIDYVLIDTNYNGNVFNVRVSDIPAKKRDLIKGEYKLEVNKGVKLAVKIVDMLGEEVLLIL